MKTKEISLCLAIMLLTGCSKKPYEAFVSEKKDFKCEIPSSDWIIKNHSGYLLGIMSEEDIERVGAHISISWQRMPAERIKKSMDIARKIWVNDPDFRMEPLKTIRIGDYTGMTYSITNLNVGMAVLSRQPPPGRKVQLPVVEPIIAKETYIYFSALEKDYYIHYTAPVAIYDKYYPALEHLLKTFQRINIEK